MTSSESTIGLRAVATGTAVTLGAGGGAVTRGRSGEFDTTIGAVSSVGDTAVGGTARDRGISGADGGAAAGAVVAEGGDRSDDATGVLDGA